MRCSERAVPPKTIKVYFRAYDPKEHLHLSDEVIEDRGGSTRLRWVRQIAAAEIFGRKKQLLRKCRKLEKRDKIGYDPKQNDETHTDVKFWYHQCPTAAHMFASLANTPAVSRGGDSGMTSSSATAPCEGRLPKIPLAPAGPRIDPPVSVPMA